MTRGKLILLMGPTGSGKGTLIRNATARFPELSILQSYTSRPRRPDHVENTHYVFITPEAFKERIERGEFLEWAEFSGNYYGTLKSDVEEALRQGKIVIKEMEVQGIRQVKDLLPREDYLTVFIDAGTWEDMAARAMRRDPLSETELARRKARYEDEVTFMPEADVIVSNLEGKRAEADREFEAVITGVIEEA